MGIENPAAPKQTARGSTGTRCQRVGGSELVPSWTLFKHIYTANAPELPNRTRVCFRYVLPELPGRWICELFFIKDIFAPRRLA